MTGPKAYAHLKALQARAKEIERMMELNQERGENGPRRDVILQQLGFIENDVLAIYREVNHDQKS